MKRGSVYFREKSINVAKQNLKMKQLFPHFELFNRQNKYWIGSVNSTLHHDKKYLVKIIYHPVYPKVFILKPTLLSKSPHRYSDGSLCLFYPIDRSFSSVDYIADTIVLWTCEWIYFYEKWLIEGVWWGEEARHDLDSRRGIKISNKYSK